MRGRTRLHCDVLEFDLFEVLDELDKHTHDRFIIDRCKMPECREGLPHAVGCVDDLVLHWIWSMNISFS